MVEIIDHKVYELLRTEYQQICLDFFVFLHEEEYEGEQTHRKAVCKAFEIMNRKLESKGYSVSFCEEKMLAEKISKAEFLELPVDSCYDSRIEGERAHNIPVPLPYWYAFLEPPNDNSYLEEDYNSLGKYQFQSLINERIK
ncbi:MAG: hypothetical protein Q4B85_07375, partial [Lachnospiraceae bacterium]|nr:hypothetical protein [Lachnospiraceae bacterium]